MQQIIYAMLMASVLSSTSITLTTDEILWNKVDTGLLYGEYISPQKSSYGDSKISFLKIDPTLYSFNLFSAKEKGESIKTVKEWGKAKEQIAVINAGMYQTDFATNVGYMKHFDFINNGHVNNNNTILVFNRKDKTIPAIQIIDLQCQNWEILKSKYNSFTQSIRMVDCNQNNKWSQQPKKWSIVLVGIDNEGHCLFIFSRSPYSVHDFINILLNAPIDLYNAMYLEGGPEASFYLSHNSILIEKMGSFETGFIESNNNTQFWQIPNVIGISKK